MHEWPEDVDVPSQEAHAPALAGLALALLEEGRSGPTSIVRTRAAPAAAFCPPPTRRAPCKMAQRTNRLLLLGLLLAAFFLWRKDWLLPSLTTEADIQSPESPDSAALGQQQPQAGPPAALPPPPLPHPPPPPPNEHSFKPSSHALALQGYNVFDHLYLSAGKLVYAPSPSSSSGSGPRVEPADVISEDPEARFAQVDDGETWFDALEGRDEGVRVIPGSTVRSPFPPASCSRSLARSHARTRRSPLRVQDG